LIIFGTTLSEEIYDQKIINLSTSPVKCNCPNLQSANCHFSSTFNSTSEYTVVCKVNKMANDLDLVLLSGTL